jgi:precorrin-2 dehydrogenase/sirohydrochlorin ferrochelatase
MLPTVLTLRGWRIFVLGRGKAAVRRLLQAEEAGAEDITIFSPGADDHLKAHAKDRLRERWPQETEWASARLAFIAGESEAVSATLAEAAGRHRLLVNVEDRPALCDFYMPSVLRRGDLLLSVSTGGAAPALGQAVIADLGRRYGPEWAERSAEVASLRREWKVAGHDMAAVAEKTKAYLKEKGWLS